MKKTTTVLQTLLIVFCAGLALLMVVDYCLPGTKWEENVQEISTTYVRSFKGGSRGNYSFALHTPKHTFTVTQDFALAAQKGEKVQYSVSPVFKEVNWTQLSGSGLKEFHPLWLLSGLVFPLLGLVGLGLGLYFKNKVDTLVFVVQVMIVTDFIFLLN